jgi:hypothetical protein
MYNINELYPPNENDQGGNGQGNQNGNQNDQGNNKSTAAPKDTNATTKKPSNQNQQ